MSLFDIWLAGYQSGYFHMNFCRMIKIINFNCLPRHFLTKFYLRRFSIISSFIIFSSIYSQPPRPQRCIQSACCTNRCLFTPRWSFILFSTDLQDSKAYFVFILPWTTSMFVRLMFKTVGKVRITWHWRAYGYLLSDLSTHFVLF